MNNVSQSFEKVQGVLEDILGATVEVPEFLSNVPGGFEKVSGYIWDAMGSLKRF